MLQSTLDSANITLSALREQYHNYSLTIRNIQAESVKRQFTYTNRLFDYFGPPKTAASNSIRQRSASFWSITQKDTQARGQDGICTPPLAASCVSHMKSSSCRATYRLWCQRYGGEPWQNYPKPCRKHASRRCKEVSTAHARLDGATRPSSAC